MLKKEFINKVNDIQDPQLLEELLEAEIDHSNELTEEEKIAIDEGIDDADSGNVHSNSDASELVQKWLRK